MDIDELLDDYACEIILRKTCTDSETERPTLYEDLNCLNKSTQYIFILVGYLAKAL